MEEASHGSEPRAPAPGWGELPPPCHVSVHPLPSEAPEGHAQGVCVSRGPLCMWALRLHPSDPSHRTWKSSGSGPTREALGPILDREPLRTPSQTSFADSCEVPFILLS
jgi:hypothetical protein